MPPEPPPAFAMRTTSAAGARSYPGVLRDVALVVRLVRLGDLSEQYLELRGEQVDQFLQPPVRPWTGVTPSPLSQPPSLLASALVEAHHVHHPVTALPMSPHCRGDSVSAQGAAHAGRSHNQHDRQSGHLSHLLNASWHRSGSRAHLHRRVGARRARCPTSRSGTASLAKRCQRRALPGR